MTLRRNGMDKNKVLITSLLFNGLSYILYFGQYLKGIVLMLVEVVMLLLAPKFWNALQQFMTLGSPNTEIPIAQRDNSAFMMIDGIVVLLILFLYICLYVYHIQASIKEYFFYCKRGYFHKLNKTLAELIRDSFVGIGLLPTLIFILFLVVVPLVFSVLAAFTSLSAPANIAPSMTFDWVGFSNFADLFGGQVAWSGAFVRVLLWTLLFAVCSTALCYAGGLLLAYILHHNRFRVQPVIQVILMLPYAIPAVVSMLVWRTLLNGSFGVVNRTLIAWGIIENPIPWLSDPVMAKITCILVSLWAGYSYFMLLLLTTLNTISPAIYDAAETDGATRGQVIRKVIVPLLIERTTPFIFLSFAQNLNNFATVFFLTEGNPTMANTTTTSAGGTDTLVTWIYNLTFKLMKFNYASVITVVLFVVLIPISIYQFRKTDIYRKEK